MPRVLISDTEAFAPRPVAVQREKSEDQTLKDLEKLKLGFQIAGAAAPFAGMAVSGLDKYLYSPISEKVKEHFKTGREKEYYGKGVGEQLLEEGAVPPAAAAEPGAGGMATSEKKVPSEVGKAAAEADAAVPPVVGDVVSPASAEVVKKIAQERKAAQQGMAPAQAPSYAELGEPGKKPSAAEERKAVAESFGEARPEFKELQVPVGKIQQRIDELSSIKTSDPIRASAIKQELDDLRSRLGQSAAIRDKIDRLMSLKTGEPTQASLIHEKVKGLYDKLGQIEGGAAPEAPTPPAVGAAPAERGQHVVDIVPGKEYSGYLPKMVYPEERPLAGAPSETAAFVAEELARSKKPAEGPKTLGNASEDELNKAKYKLQYLVDQKKADPTAAAAVAQAQNRIDLIDKELQHRSEFIPFEEWAARARAAETPAEQAEVMRQAERVGMPVSDLADLFKTRVQRGKALALGTREEPGLFPQLGRPLSEEDAEFKRIKTALMLRGATAKEAELMTRARMEERHGEFYRERGAQVKTETPYRAGRLAEDIMLTDVRHHVLSEKLPYEIARLKADAARMYAAAGNMRDRRNLDWYLAHNKRAEIEIRNADKNVEDAQRAAEQSQNSAIAAERNFQSHIQEMADLEKAAKNLDRDSPGYNSAMVRIREMKSKVPGLQRARDMARDQQIASNEVLKGVHSVREEAGRFADAAKQAADQYATIERKERKIAPLPKPAPAPIKEEKPGIGEAFRRILGGGGAPAAAQAGERRTAKTQDGRKVTVEKRSDGNWHEVK